MTAIDIAVLREHPSYYFKSTNGAPRGEYACWGCGEHLCDGIWEDKRAAEAWLAHLAAVQASLPESPARPADAEGALRAVIRQVKGTIGSYQLNNPKEISMKATVDLNRELDIVGKWVATPSPAVNQSVPAPPSESMLLKDLKAFRSVIDLHLALSPLDSYAEGVVDAYRACANQLDKFIAEAGVKP